MDKVKQFFRKIFEQLVTINDSPQKIAVGFGLGVFLGILPGTGPVAAVALSFLLRVNRAAAFAGSLLTNTWLSVVCFLLAIKLGAQLTGVEWIELRETYLTLWHDFHFSQLMDVTFWKIMKPLLVGFSVCGLLAGIFAYLLALFVLMIYRRKHS